jgi:hypothetical protein
MSDVNRTGRAAAGVLVAVVVAVLALFAPTATASGVTPSRADTTLAAAAPSAHDGSGACWRSLRQPRGYPGPATARGQVLPALLAGTGLAAAVLVLRRVRPPVNPHHRAAATGRLPGVRAPPASDA